MSNIIKIANLSKKYFSKVALNEVSISFETGKIYGLLGPNGSGKTTLMKVIAGLHKHTSGDVTIKDLPISFKTKAQVVFMPTEDYLYSFMKLTTVIKYFNEMYQDFDLNKAHSLLEKLELNPKQKVSDLSTGLKGRLKVLLAVSRKAPIYMFDEPLNGLDPISREIVLQLINEVSSESNSVIISSHLVSELETILDRVVLLKNGEIVVNEDAEDIRFNKGKSIEELYKEVYLSC
ncbi:ABC transporter ATP-binding protein [Clostridium sp. 'deep sea']|uniref:ABC transporter ATP-binding protein n=1 Tax=Clostridium sp. 'deep sea' TaxID=2779445 RepID=UPI0018966F80|nr:ABC transporter ATP-binding protein [Clostridium sp. 'deep sea']QOR35270.1 ABC transporter ATP-binding protein [Clostridium sp. 'deep sea']